MSDATKVTRDDIESKFRELQEEMNETAEGAKTPVLAAGVVAALLLLLVVFLLGKRAGKKRSTIVEIRRL